MTDFDDYQDEMRWASRLSENEVEATIAGVPPEGDSELARVAEILSSARYALLETPREHVEQHHLAAIATAFRLPRDASELPRRPHEPAMQEASAWGRWSFARTARTIALRAAGGIAAASLAIVGLAYAGVDLPGTATEQVVHALTGLKLPNQAQPEPRIASRPGADRLPVQPAVPPDCAFGRTLTERADDASAPNLVDGELRVRRCDAGGARARTDQSKSGGGGSREATSTQESTSPDTASDDDFRWDEDGASVGKSIADGASDTWRPDGDGGPDEEGEDANPTGYGKETGEDAADEGQSNNPTDKGRP